MTRMSKCSSSVDDCLKVSLLLPHPERPLGRGHVAEAPHSRRPLRRGNPCNLTKANDSSTYASSRLRRNIPALGDVRLGGICANAPSTAAKYPGRVAGAAITVRMMCHRVTKTRISPPVSHLDSTGNIPCNRAVSKCTQAAFLHRQSAEHGREETCCSTPLGRTRGAGSKDRA